MTSNPIESRGGRPPYRPTAAARRQVAIAAGGGMHQREIALALGITTVTLRKHFALELGAGAARRRMEALGGLYRAAKRGSASAAKAYLAHEPERPNRTAETREDAAAGKEPKLAKKGALRRAAEAAASPGSSFAPAPPPRLVIDNAGGR